MRFAKSYGVLHAGSGFLAAALFGSLGCWGEASSRHAVEPTPGSAGSSAVGGTPGAAATPASPSAATVATQATLERNYSREDPALAVVLGLLDGSCNSGMDTSSNDVIDYGRLAQLIGSGDIIPGSGASSPLVARLREQMAASQPPSCLGLPQLAQLVRFIDELDLTPLEPCTPLAPLTQDQIQSALATDITAQPEPDRPFLRYLSLTYASNAGVCGQGLERERQALFEAVNAVSTAPVLHLPVAIDADAVLYRIDLRHFGWDRPIQLGADPKQRYADGWLAILAGTLRFSSQLAGPEADVVRQWSGTGVALLPADVFLQSALQRDQYYALSGLDGLSGNEQSLLDVALDRGVEMRAPAPGNVARAGFTVGSANQETKRVSRFSGAGSTPPWWVLEAGTEPSVVREPLAEFQGGMFLYRLPNGMPAFAVAQQQGRVLTEAPYVDFGQRAPTGAIVGAGCFGCHGGGVIAAPDEVQALVLAQPRQFADAAAVLAEYPGSAVLGQVTALDNAVFAAARQGAGVTGGGSDPLAHVFLRFRYTAVSLPVAAAELGVTPTELLTRLAGDPRFAPLRETEGTIDRLSWEAAYAEFFCALSHRPWQNVPVERCEWR